MNQIFKKMTVAALLFAVALTGCKSTTDTKSAKKDTDEKADIVVISHPLSCEVDGEETATGKYPEIVLSKAMQKKYPELWESISMTNTDWESMTKRTVGEYGVVDEEIPHDMPFVFEYDIKVLRCDEKLLTFELNYYDESGGAHPNHGTTTLNYDPEEGCYLSIEAVVNDTHAFASDIRKEMEKEYDEETMQVIDDYHYYDSENDMSEDVFENMIDTDSLTWVLDEKGITVLFSPYVIAPYAYGELAVTLSYEDYPDLINEEYRLDKAQDLSKIVKYKEDKIEKVEPENSGDDNESESWTLDNPSWDYYVEDYQVPTSKSPIQLVELSKEKTDWLVISDWASQNGFDVADPCYGDDEYSYLPMYGETDEYNYSRLRVYPANEDGIVCEYDFNLLCNGPDNRDGTYSKVKQTIRYEKIVGETLYVEISHMGYASEESNSAYIVAIDLNTNEVLFKTEPLTANASNFQIYDDFIICGYGFTGEDDYLYILDRFTGKRLESIKLNSAAEQIEIADDILYVATYDTAYQFKITQ